MWKIMNTCNTILFNQNENARFRHADNASLTRLHRFKETNTRLPGRCNGNINTTKIQKPLTGLYKLDWFIHTTNVKFRLTISFGTINVNCSPLEVEQSNVWSTRSQKSPIIKTHGLNVEIVNFLLLYTYCVSLLVFSKEPLCSKY